MLLPLLNLDSTLLVFYLTQIYIITSYIFGALIYAVIGPLIYAVIGPLIYAVIGSLIYAVIGPLMTVKCSTSIKAPLF